MHRMDSTSHQMPYWWGVLLNADALRLRFLHRRSDLRVLHDQNLLRLATRKPLEEEGMRTEMLRACLDSVIVKPESELTTAAKVIVKAVTKATEGERMDDMTYL